MTWEEAVSEAPPSLLLLRSPKHSPNSRGQRSFIADSRGVAKAKQYKFLAMPRFGSLYPFVFGATLVVLAVAFHGRRKLFPEVFEEQRRLAIEGRRRAQEIRTAVAKSVQDGKGENKTN